MNRTPGVPGPTSLSEFHDPRRRAFGGRPGPAAGPGIGSAGKRCRDGLRRRPLGTMGAGPWTRWPAGRRAAPSPDREGSQGNADEDGLNEDGVVQVSEETRTRARKLISVEQDVRDPVPDNAVTRAAPRNRCPGFGFIRARTEHTVHCFSGSSLVVRARRRAVGPDVAFAEWTRAEGRLRRRNAVFRRIEYQPGSG